MMLNTIRYLIPLAGLLLALGAEAQQLNNPCPGGGVPSGGRCVSPAEANANRGGGSSRPVHTEIWEDRYGAIAVDFENPKTGASENQKSERAAKRLALKKCGSSRCEIVNFVRNNCLAAAYGEGWLGYGSNPDIELAKKKALNNCENKGGKCKIEYASCSLPVRVK